MVEECPACGSEDTEVEISQDKNWVKCHDCKYSEKLLEQQIDALPIEDMIKQADVGQWGKDQQTQQEQDDENLRDLIKGHEEIVDDKYDPNNPEALEAMEAVNYNAALEDDQAMSVDYSGDTHDPSAAYDAAIADACCQHPGMERSYSAKDDFDDSYVM